MESVGGKRKIDEEIEMAKQKAQAIAARLISDAAAADSKRPRTSDFTSGLPPPPPDYSSSFSSSSQPSSFPVSYTPQSSSNNGVPSSKRMVIPNGKVGVIIGRGGDMIKNLQTRSGARIQITRDNEADRSALTRDVELMGTLDEIARAEQLINDTIAETDAATSGPTGNRGAPPLQAGAEQFVMKVPNDKVALVIGKGGETIKTMQNKSGARLQVVPLHLPPGDTSTERNVFINGTQEQIESAKELVNEVITGNRLKVLSGNSTYTQPAYGAGWASQGQPPAQQPPAYGYAQAGTYAMPPQPYYAGYPPQPASWDQQTNAAAPPQQQNAAYNTYGQAPPTSTPPNVGYNYGQMPPAAGYNYHQGYAQQPPSYGQDMSGQGQAPDQAKPYANPAYGPPTTSSQPDGSAAGQTAQPGYGTPAASGQPDGTGQSQPPSAYATGYNQAAAAPANGYSAYPSYSAAPPVQPAYGQTGYPQTGYGQQEGQVANQAAYSYYAQSGYPPAPAQASYYQGAYPAVPPPQAPPQIQPTNGVPQSSPYGVERTDGDSSTVSGAAAEGSEKPQS